MNCDALLVIAPIFCRFSFRDSLFLRSSCYFHLFSCESLFNLALAVGLDSPHSLDSEFPYRENRLVTRTLHESPTYSENFTPHSQQPLSKQKLVTLCLQYTLAPATQNGEIE